MAGSQRHDISSSASCRRPIYDLSQKQRRSLLHAAIPLLIAKLELMFPGSSIHWRPRPSCRIPRWPGHLASQLTSLCYLALPWHSGYSTITGLSFMITELSSPRSTNGKLMQGQTRVTRTPQEACITLPQRGKYQPPLTLNAAARTPTISSRSHHGLASKAIYPTSNCMSAPSKLLVWKVAWTTERHFACKGTKWTEQT